MTYIYTGNKSVVKGTKQKDCYGPFILIISTACAMVRILLAGRTTLFHYKVPIVSC